MVIQMKFVNGNLNIQYQKEDAADFHFVTSNDSFDFEQTGTIKSESWSIR